MKEIPYSNIQFFILRLTSTCSCTCASLYLSFTGTCISKCSMCLISKVRSISEWLFFGCVTSYTRASLTNRLILLAQGLTRYLWVLAILLGWPILPVVWNCLTLKMWISASFFVCFFLPYQKHYFTVTPSYKTLLEIVQYVLGDQGNTAMLQVAMWHMELLCLSLSYIIER